MVLRLRPIGGRSLSSSRRAGFGPTRLLDRFPAKQRDVRDDLRSSATAEERSSPDNALNTRTRKKPQLEQCPTEGKNRRHTNFSFRPDFH